MTKKHDVSLWCALSLILSLLWTSEVSTVYAGTVRLNVGVGVTKFLPTTPDGVWIQEAFEHSYQTTSIGFKGGLEYMVTENWSLGGNYVRLGAVKAFTLSVLDEHYDPVAHVCTADCTHPTPFYSRDLMQGVEGFLQYKYTSTTLQPFANIGFAMLYHAVKASSHPEGLAQIADVFRGTVPTMRIGGGLCYQWLCGDTTYYRGIGAGTNYPIAKDALLTTVFLSIPFTY